MLKQRYGADSCHRRGPIQWSYPKNCITEGTRIGAIQYRGIAAADVDVALGIALHLEAKHYGHTLGLNDLRKVNLLQVRRGGGHFPSLMR